MERAGVACADCHTVHAAEDPVRVNKTQAEVCFACHAEQRADSFKYSHHPIREGKVVCSDCHNPMGSDPARICSRSSRSTRPATTATPTSAGRCCGSTSRFARTAPTATRRTARAEARLMKENMGFMCSSCHSARVRTTAAERSAAGTRCLAATCMGWRLQQRLGEPEVVPELPLAGPRVEQPEWRLLPPLTRFR